MIWVKSHPLFKLYYMILYNNIYANLDELLTGRPLKIAQNLSAKNFSFST